MEVALGVEDVCVVGPLMDGTCVRQSFTAVKYKLVSFVLFLGMRENPEESYIIADLLDASRNVLGTVTRNAHVAAEPGGWCEFVFNRDVTMGGRYEVMVRTLNCRAGMSPLVYCGIQRVGEYMFLGSKLVRGCELRCKFVYGDEG